MVTSIGARLFGHNAVRLLAEVLTHEAARVTIATVMNWYFENSGVSEGPFTETALAMRVQKGDIAADTLIWNPSLDEWQSVQSLRPDWLTPVVVAAPVEAAPPPARPATRPLAPSTDPGDGKVGFFKKIFGRGKKA